LKLQKTITKKLFLCNEGRISSKVELTYAPILESDSDSDEPEKVELEEQDDLFGDMDHWAVDEEAIR